MLKPITLAFLFTASSAHAQQYLPFPDQYPKPLVHTATDHPAAHILLIVVDGLHAFDLAAWTAAHPDSALATLSRRGVSYTNAHAPVADSAAGLLALVTGGTPLSTGITAVNGYDRSLSAPGSTCKSTGAALDLNAAAFPLDPRAHCAPVSPHQLLRVNTMFEVVHEKIGPTAWAGDDGAIADLLRGPSGKGLDCVAATTGDDSGRVATVLGWLNPQGAAGCAHLPALIGISLTTVAAADRDTAGGYTDIAPTPSARLEKAFADTDHSIAKLIAGLQARRLYDSTWIVVAAARAFPLVATPRHAVPLASLRRAVAAPVARITGGTSAQIWLVDSARTAAASKALRAQAATLGIARIVSGSELALTMSPPAADPRSPDIVLEAEPGTRWTSPLASDEGAGSGSDAETHVALLVAGAQLTGRTDPTPVPTTQLAPLLLRALGMEKFDLNALHHEHAPALPGIF